MRPAPAGVAGYQRAPTGAAARETNGSNVPPRRERGWGDESPSQDPLEQCPQRWARATPGCQPSLEAFFSEAQVVTKKSLTFGQHLAQYASGSEDWAKVKDFFVTTWASEKKASKEG